MSKPRCTSADAWEQRLKRFPPILIRLLARTPRGGPLTTEEIAKRSGLTEMDVSTISRSTSWDGIDIPTYLAFTRACNLNLMDATQAKRQIVYLDGKMVNGVRQAPHFNFLKRSPGWEGYYRPLMERYVRSLTESRKAAV